MEQHELIELGERLEGAFNRGDWDTYSALMTDSTTYVSPRIQARGPEEIIQFVKGVKEAYPDMTVTVDNVLACGDTLVRELTWNGTHTGPLKTAQGTIPPTNRRINFKGVVLLEASSEGKVTALREYYDRAAVMMQLGIGAPTPPPTEVRTA